MENRLKYITREWVDSANTQQQWGQAGADTSGVGIYVSVRQIMTKFNIQIWVKSGYIKQDNIAGSEKG